ncbi:hypothetical protein O181_041714 [Austropuccinia psidii MF-1]|uniref:Uncharacterized protein n=1 Tax=Austropuccinia psidii MF-1 TaxID=1389203 RepID=A0A9Q3HGS0_9BASI|nr:hypothetical protein [Austropuccinia psidii MF-1]
MEDRADENLADCIGCQFIVESKIQKQLSLNQGKIQKLSQGYGAIKKSMNVLTNKELQRVYSLCTSNDLEWKVVTDKRSQALRFIERGDLDASYYLSHTLRTYNEQLESYQVASERFIHIFTRMLAEMKKVDLHIALLVENYLPQLAGFTSAWIRNKAKSSTPPTWWTKLHQFANFLGLKRSSTFRFDFSKEVLSFCSASPDEIIPAEIVDMINQMRASDVAAQLNNIFQKLNILSMKVESPREEHELSLVTRVLCEKYVFQALNFFHQNQLWDQNGLKVFFSTENTLKRTCDHLRDLFKRRTNPGQDLYFGLMPELSFVLNDWNTAHLHNLLRGDVDVILMNVLKNIDLDRTQQARLVELMLIGSIKEFKRTLYFRRASPEVVVILDKVTEDRILKHWWSDEPPNPLQKNTIDNWILELVEFFGKTGASKKRFEYLISYYVLNFIKTYQTRDFPTLPFKNLNESRLFDMKFELFQAGIRLHEAVNRSLDYEHLLELPSEQLNHLTTEITSERVESAKMAIVEKEKEYKMLKKNIEKFPKEEQLLLSNWMQNNFFLQFYDTLPLADERRSLWSFFRLPLTQITTEAYYYLPINPHYQ